nr:tetratricopeptide repeat protein [Thermoflexibacter sp.]
QGVDIQLVILDDYVNKRVEGLPFDELIKAGGKVYFSDKMTPIHHKFCIIDHQTLLNGSYDWTYFSERKAMENIILIKENQSIITEFETEFELIVSTLPLTSQVNAYTISEGLINDYFGLKNYLSEDVYLQALIAGENGDDMNALALMHHSTLIDEYKTEVQQQFIQEKTVSSETIKEEEEALEEENQADTQPIYTSRGLGITTTYEPLPVEEEPVNNTEEPLPPAEDVFPTNDHVDNTTSEELVYEYQTNTDDTITEVPTDIQENSLENVGVDNQDTNYQSTESPILEEEPSPNEEVPTIAPTPNPEAESMIQQGEFIYQQGRLEEAIQLFMQAINIQVDNPTAYLNIAIVKWRQGKFQEQAQFASQSIQYDPTNAKAYNTLGLALDRLGNHIEAVENYTKALEIHQDNYSYLWNRGLALKVLGRRQEALLDMGKVIKLCNQVLMSQPTNQNARQTLTAAMKEMGT